MRFLSFSRNGQAGFGALVDGGVVDLSARYPELPDLRTAIAAGRLEELAASAANTFADFGMDEVLYLPTIPNPQKIVCIGVNYAERNAEYRDGSAAPSFPSVFMRARESLTGHEAPLLRPPESEQLDYEGEIVLVIGRQGRRIRDADAHEYVAGVTIMNEGSVRDWLRHAKFNVTQGKNFERSGALGPWLVTPDELDPMGKLQVITRVNGEERQNDVTDNLIFPFRYLLSYLSTFYRLQPGDVIATGTPNGAGARFDPPKYLRAGDVVEVEVPGIGVLRNEVEDEVL
jgi:2-keto-4-pentenoate hydratase/2-oxohepta-3-ene-1,7-dioic acid hydratase in catechol pathway